MKIKHLPNVDVFFKTGAFASHNSNVLDLFEDLGRKHGFQQWSRRSWSFWSICLTSGFLSGSPVSFAVHVV
jgi:hypothetical protein